MLASINNGSVTFRIKKIAGDNRHITSSQESHPGERVPEPEPLVFFPLLSFNFISLN